MTYEKSYPHLSSFYLNHYTPEEYNIKKNEKNKEKRWYRICYNGGTHGVI